MTLPLRTITDGQPDSEGFAISDLFFHMRHTEYDQMKDDKAAQPSDIQQAIENDAIKMRFWLSELGHQVSIEQLVDDFFDRLKNT